MERKQGISLVALIITIIVLIILTGTVIITMNQGNTIEKSEEAVFKSDLTNFRDQLVMKILDKQAKMEITGKSDASLNNVTGDNLRTWVPSITDKYIGKLAIKEGNLYYTDTTNEEEYGWAAELDMVDIENTLATQVKVGDYIEYTPGGGSYTAISENTGYGTQAYVTWYTNAYDSAPTIENEGNQTFESTTEEETWRILSVEGANITIMRGEPTKDLELWGKRGDDNVEEVLNEICGIYKNEVYAESARSITIEDINKVTGYLIPEESTANNSGEYGSIGYGGNKCTYYMYNTLAEMPNIESASDSKYTMIFGDNDKNYWVASRCARAFASSVRLYIRSVECVDDSCVNANYLNSVNDDGRYERNYSLGVCPVVVLKSTVSIGDGSGIAGDPWKIQ